MYHYWFVATAVLWGHALVMHKGGVVKHMRGGPRPWQGHHICHLLLFIRLNMLLMQEACLGQAEEQRISRPDRTAVHPTHHPSRSDLPAVPQPGHC